MTKFGKPILVAAVAAAALAASFANASAAVACTGNVCWHIQEKYAYPDDAHVTVHPDGWSPGDRYVWREHEGQGYWHGDEWREY